MASFYIPHWYRKNWSYSITFSLFLQYFPLFPPYFRHLPHVTIPSYALYCCIPTNHFCCNCCSCFTTIAVATVTKISVASATTIADVAASSTSVTTACCHKCHKYSCHCKHYHNNYPLLQTQIPLPSVIPLRTPLQRSSITNQSIMNTINDVTSNTTANSTMICSNFIIHRLSWHKASMGTNNFVFNDTQRKVSLYLSGYPSSACDEFVVNGGSIFHDNWLNLPKVVDHLSCRSFPCMICIMQ